MKYYKFYADEIEGIFGPHRDYTQEDHLIDRSTRGFSDVDTWSFDMYFATVLANYFRHHRKNLTGHPENIDADKWKADLKRAENIFARYSEKGSDVEYWDEDNRHSKELKWALEFFVKSFRSFWE